MIVSHDGKTWANNKTYRLLTDFDTPSEIIDKICKNRTFLHVYGMLIVAHPNTTQSVLHRLLNHFDYQVQIRAKKRIIPDI